MVFVGRVWFALLLFVALTACSGQTGLFPAAQDAQLIVKNVSPVAESIGALGASAATVAVVTQNLTQARRESAALDHQFSPNLLDVQQFYGAAQTLLATLSAVPGLPPQSVDVVDAATALLPTFPAVDSSPPPPGPFKMSVAQARVLLGGASSVAAPAPPARPEPVVTVAPAPAPRLASAPRFHMSIDDLGEAFRYEFSDRGQVMDKGQLATLRLVEARFEAFKKDRLAQKP